MQHPSAAQTIRGMTGLASTKPEQARGPGSRLLAGFASGAAVAYLLDPACGHRRRAQAAAIFRHSRHSLARRGRVRVLRSLGRARGVLYRLRRPTPREALDDAGLAHKVESVLFRDPHVPKGEISINAERGAVFLRGQVASAELIDDLAEAVWEIRGVDEVVNLLHLPGTEAPRPGAERRAARSDPSR